MPKKNEGPKNGKNVVGESDTENESNDADNMAPEVNQGPEEIRSPASTKKGKNQRFKRFELDVAVHSTITNKARATGSQRLRSANRQIREHTGLPSLIENDEGAIILTRPHTTEEMANFQPDSDTDSGTPDNQTVEGVSPRSYAIAAVADSSAGISASGSATTSRAVSSRTDNKWARNRNTLKLSTDGTRKSDTIPGVGANAVLSRRPSTSIGNNPQVAARSWAKVVQPPTPARMHPNRKATQPQNVPQPMHNHAIFSDRHELKWTSHAINSEGFLENPPLMTTDMIPVNSDRGYWCATAYTMYDNEMFTLNIVYCNNSWMKYSLLDPSEFEIALNNGQNDLGKIQVHVSNGIVTLINPMMNFMARLHARQSHPPPEWMIDPNQCAYPSSHQGLYNNAMWSGHVNYGGMYPHNCTYPYTNSTVYYNTGENTANPWMPTLLASTPNDLSELTLDDDSDSEWVTEMENEERERQARQQETGRNASNDTRSDYRSAQGTSAWTNQMDYSNHFNWESGIGMNHETNVSLYQSPNDARLGIWTGPTGPVANPNISAGPDNSLTSRNDYQCFQPHSASTPRRPTRGRRMDFNENYSTLNQIGQRKEVDLTFMKGDNRGMLINYYDVEKKALTAEQKALISSAEKEYKKDRSNKQCDVANNEEDESRLVADMNTMVDEFLDKKIKAKCMVEAHRRLNTITIQSLKYRMIKQYQNVMIWYLNYARALEKVLPSLKQPTNNHKQQMQWNDDCLFKNAAFWEQVCGRAGRREKQEIEDIIRYAMITNMLITSILGTKTNRSKFQSAGNGAEQQFGYQLIDLGLQRMQVETGKILNIVYDTRKKIVINETTDLSQLKEFQDFFVGVKQFLDKLFKDYKMPRPPWPMGESGVENHQ